MYTSPPQSWGLGRGLPCAGRASPLSSIPNPQPGILIFHFECAAFVGTIALILYYLQWLYLARGWLLIIRIKTIPGHRWQQRLIFCLNHTTVCCNITFFIFSYLHMLLKTILCLTSRSSPVYLLAGKIWLLSLLNNVTERERELVY